MSGSSYTAFSLELHRMAAGRRLPLDGTIEVTHRCPLSCRHCCNNLAISDGGARRGELSAGEHFRLLDEIAEAGCLWLLFTGGEVFARPDFLDIYTRAQKNGFLVSVFTNGTMITPAIADHFAEWRPFSIEVTLYGRTRETYELMTGSKGSFDRCIRGITLLRDRGLPLELKTVATSLNRHEVFEMKKYAKEELGVPFRFDALLNPRLDCSQSPLAVRLAPADVVAMDLLDESRMEGWRQFCDRFLGPAAGRPDLDRLYRCGAGSQSFSIDPEGMLSVCLLSRRDRYDLRRGSFREGWEGFLASVQNRTVSRPSKCVACPILAMCGMCPANGELESGDPETPVEFLCEVAHLRALVMGIAVSPHGDCDCCAGGRKAEGLSRTAERLLPLKWTKVTETAPVLLPVLEAAPSVVSCVGAAASGGPGCAAGG